MAAGGSPCVGIVVLDDRTGKGKRYLPRSALTQTILIGGVPDQGEYLLLEMVPGRFIYGGVLRITSDFKATRYTDISAYLVDVYTGSAQLPK